MSIKNILNTKYLILNTISVLFIGLMFLISSPAQAATFYLYPPQMTIGPDDVVEVQVKVGVGDGECINTAQVGITFPNDILQFVDFNSGQSFLTLWVQKPDKDSLAKINSEGKIIFSGGLPGGYCGIIPGDPGDSNILGSFIFTPKKPIARHQAKIDFNLETEAYLNDGSGTPVPINTQGAVLQIDEKIATKTNFWASEIADDKIPPEAFTIEIDNTPRVASGKYFVVFSTVDKQTGIDHYEVWEAKPQDLLGKKENVLARFVGHLFQSPEALPPAWLKVNSPYILKDQSLKSTIKVKAVDRAGNERVVEYDNAAALQALKNPRPFNQQSIIYIGAGLLLIVLILAAFFSLRRKK
jgi:hypothetical protein